MQHFTSGELSIDVRHSAAGAIRLTWRGRSSARNPGTELNPFLSTILDEATSGRAPLELHFEELDYFNSSTVSVLWEFVGRARHAKVPLTFTYTESLGWQRMSFGALRVVARMDAGVQVLSTVEAQQREAVARTGSG